MAKIQAGKSPIKARDVRGSSHVDHQATLTPFALSEGDDAEIEALLGIPSKPTLKAAQKKPITPQIEPLERCTPLGLPNRRSAAIPPKKAGDRVPTPPVDEAADNRKIKVLNKENPHREQSNRAAQFDLVLGSKTVEDYLAAGGKSKYLDRWVESGHISVE